MSSHSDRTTRPRIPIKAPRGLELSCNGWQQEAALRMLMNSVDEEAAETPTSGGVDHDTLCVVGDWQSFDDIVRSLRTLENDETLLVHGDKIADIFPTHACAPRVIVCQETACDEAQAHAPAGEKSSEPEPSPIMAYRERIATSWLRIGSQELVQLLFENFSEVGEQHFGAGKGSASVEPSEPGCELAGKLIVSGGMGRLSGAQPLAATLAGAAFLGIDVDPECIKRRMKSGACDFMVNSLEEALRILKNAVRKRENISVGLVGNCAAVIPELAERGVVPDILTDFTRRTIPAATYRMGLVWPGRSSCGRAICKRTSSARGRRLHGRSKRCSGCRRWGRLSSISAMTCEQ
jgi:urocanate hydratase